MLPLRDQKTVYQTPKCYFSYGMMPHVDTKQPPSKGKPWTALAARDFIHQVDLVLPQDAFKAFKEQALDGKQSPQFKRVVMTLGQVIEKDFLVGYIKTGNILMLSEGRPGQDNVFTIKAGKLTMFLDKETYERAGMVGETHGVKGDRCSKPRWIVEYDLCAPYAFPGKKGFDRLVYATKNAINFPVAWLFCNLSKTPDPDPLAAHFPTTFTSSPGIVQSISALVPSLKPSPDTSALGDREESERFATETYEWLSLIRLCSPRVAPDDDVDPYLSLYRVPDDNLPEGTKADTLCKLTWRGLLPAEWARGLFIDALSAVPSRAWFALSLGAFDASSRGLANGGPELTVMRPPGAPGEYLQWEVKSHE
ncbi:hypothetical protein RB601_005114 [Gaeumannomyces tritici]